MPACRYTLRMRSVADGLREDTRRRVAALSPSERVALALALGEADVRLYAATNGVSRIEARRRLRAGRQVGRLKSRCCREDR